MRPRTYNIKMRPRTYNIHEAKTHLSRLIEQVAAGEDVIIAKAGVPVVRLVPVILPVAERPLGTETGRLVVADDFDAPLPPDVLASFEK
jgi:prevent-host-death family protein